MTHTLVGGQRPERNPLEFCLCMLLSISIAPVMLGLEALPGSLEKVPTPFGQLSAALIFIGSVGVMLGVAWVSRDMGLLVQQASMWFLGVGLMFYGVAVWDAVGWTEGRLAIGLSLGTALGCAARVVQFQLYIRHRGATAETK